MTMYSKTGKRWSNDYEFKQVETLDRADLTSDNVSYYHHPYDHLFHNISFLESIDDKQVEHIKNNSTVRLIHENSCEAIDARFAEEVCQLISKNNINPKQIKIVVADENHKNFLDNYLKNKNIYDTNITVHNFLLSKVDEVLDEKEEGVITDKKFSSLSRNYKDWRLFLYKELFQNNILDHFTYSFHNIWPYTDKPKVFTVDQMVSDLKNLGVDNMSKSFIKWLKRCPYDIPIKTADSVQNKWSSITYDAILSADFHLMIETHFDQKAFTGQNTFDRSFGPSSITEKAYKAIACTRPFITFATPYFLEDIRGLGYKTFSPYIDESYDLELDNTKRLNMIVTEVTRICNLPETEYNELVKNCREIAKYNCKHFKEHKKTYKDAT